MSPVETDFKLVTERVLGSLVEDAAVSLRETRYCEDKSTPYHALQACLDMVTKLMLEKGVDPFTSAKALHNETQFQATHSNLALQAITALWKNNKQVSWLTIQRYTAAGILLVELEDRYPGLVNEKQQIYNEHIAWREREENSTMNR